MWTPKEVRKLLILLTGIGLEISGVFLLVNQIQATGNIDISSSLISGKIQSGNAGLLLCFIGLFVMALSIIGGKDTIHYGANLSSKSDEVDVTITTIEPEEKRSLVVIIVLGLLIFALIFGGTYLNRIKWEGGNILIVFGVLTAIVEGIMIIIFIESYLSTDKKVDLEEPLDTPAKD
jgi:hypothetical protein